MIHIFTPAVKSPFPQQTVLNNTLTRVLCSVLTECQRITAFANHAEKAGYSKLEYPAYKNYFLILSSEISFLYSSISLSFR